MGFLRNVLQWPESQLHLSAYSNLNTFGDFISFLNAREVRPEELMAQCTLGLRMNLFLSNMLTRNSQGGDGADGKAVFENAMSELKEARAQLQGMVARSRGANVR